MRRSRRKILVTGALLVVTTLTVTAAVSPQDPAPPTSPVALAQPIVMPPFFLSQGKPILHESGLLVLVGGGLFGLAALVRKTTPV